MQRYEHRFIAMGGPCQLRLDQDNESNALAALDAAEQEVRRLEVKYSRYLENSLTSRINHAAGNGEPVAVDAETAGILHYADTLYQQSNGMFDLTAGVLRRAWNFKSGALPSQAEIDDLLPLIGWYDVQWNQQEILLPRAGMEIDFGGCVKEYAADSAAAVLRNHGIDHALIDLAGDIAAVGAQASDQAWTIGIRQPNDPQQAIAQVELANAALASSGDYERCITIKGVRYSHILDPHTGWPVQGLSAVSVIGEQCLVAGSTATLAMLKPAEQALDWLASLGLPWFACDMQQQCHGTLQ